MDFTPYTIKSRALSRVFLERREESALMKNNYWTALSLRRVHRPKSFSLVFQKNQPMIGSCSRSNDFRQDPSQIYQPQQMKGQVRRSLNFEILLADCFQCAFTVDRINSSRCSDWYFRNWLLPSLTFDFLLVPEVKLMIIYSFEMIADGHKAQSESMLIYFLLVELRASRAHPVSSSWEKSWDWPHIFQSLAVAIIAPNSF